MISESTTTRDSVPKKFLFSLTDFSDRSILHRAVISLFPSLPLFVVSPNPFDVTMSLTFCPVTRKKDPRSRRRIQCGWLNSPMFPWPTGLWHVFKPEDLLFAFFPFLYRYPEPQS